MATCFVFVCVKPSMVSLHTHTQRETDTHTHRGWLRQYFTMVFTLVQTTGRSFTTKFVSNWFPKLGADIIWPAGTGAACLRLRVSCYCANQEPLERLELICSWQLPLKAPSTWTWAAPALCPLWGRCPLLCATANLWCQNHMSSF